MKKEREIPEKDSKLKSVVHIFRRLCVSLSLSLWLSLSISLVAASVWLYIINYHSKYQSFEILIDSTQLVPHCVRRIVRPTLPYFDAPQTASRSIGDAGGILWKGAGRGGGWMLPRDPWSLICVHRSLTYYKWRGWFIVTWFLIRKLSSRFPVINDKFDSVNLATEMTRLTWW